MEFIKARGHGLRTTHQKYMQCCVWMHCPIIQRHYYAYPFAPVLHGVREGLDVSTCRLTHAPLISILVGYHCHQHGSPVLSTVWAIGIHANTINWWVAQSWIRHNYRFTLARWTILILYTIHFVRPTNYKKAICPLNSWPHWERDPTSKAYYVTFEG